ncbi:MAG: pantoate--beta-alanine ligase [Tannerellaceae bacterium]|jgi:pantoate--beta-alanine ligase|nr:pantoate--beta-alanine ligase [Tannerellaceae bacterium]
MKIVNSIEELRTGLAQEKGVGRSVGFVPTMGALHDGHLSLVKQGVEENDVCVVSIFVNPTQFNDRNDLATYPRTLDKDCAMLEAAGCDYLFAPSEAEMYPVPDTRRFDFGTLSQVMEGAYRPGHFNGVAQIVSKLFDAVKPDRAYFGEKDFQQIAVVRAMAKQLDLPVQIIACPILREEDGLAMSSRNVRLTPGQRQKAPLIARTLKESTNFVPGKSVREVMEYVVHTINNEQVMRVEYFEIVDGHTLEAIENWTDTTYPVGCIVVYCGEVRLIDNIKY